MIHHHLISTLLYSITIHIVKVLETYFGAEDCEATEIVPTVVTSAGKCLFASLSSGIKLNYVYLSVTMNHGVQLNYIDFYVYSNVCMYVYICDYMYLILEHRLHHINHHI